MTSDRPTVWVEFGGQLERVDSLQDPFTPPFTSISPAPSTFGPLSPTQAQQTPQYSNGLEGSISFEPSGLDWIFSAALRYGRSNGTKHIHQQTANHSSPFGQQPYAFTDVRTKDNESHATLDFQAGRDLGLGLLGANGRSIISFGVRYVQFTSRSDVSISMNPTSNPYHYHLFYQAGHAARSFTGIGPTISWEASATVLGNRDTSEVTLDWGANAALLFGKQKADIHHATSEDHAYGGVIYSSSNARATSKSIVVPNIGGFAGFSVRYASAKVTFGYRADLFVDAMDRGIDQRESQDAAFHGPFATISMGFGG